MMSLKLSPNCRGWIGRPPVGKVESLDFRGFKWSERRDSNPRPLTPQITGNAQVLDIAWSFDRNRLAFSGFVRIQTVANCRHEPAHG